MNTVSISYMEKEGVVMDEVLRMDTGQMHTVAEMNTEYEMDTEHEMDTGQMMDTGLSTEEKAKQITKTAITKEAQKTAPNGMPVYDINEPWVQRYIEDFGTEPSFF